MIDPKNAVSENFKNFTVLYDSDRFSIAYGLFQNDRNTVAMRWNGEAGESIGYPVGKCKTPLWFSLPNKLIKPILIMLLSQEEANYSEVIRVLNKL